MHNNVVFTATIGHRSMTANFEGMNLERQRNALKTLVDNFFEDLDEEIGFYKEDEIEAAAEPVEVVAAVEEEISEEPEIIAEKSKTVKGFTMEEIARSYETSATFGGSVVTKIDDIDTYAHYPDEVQQAILAGINDRNFKVMETGQPHYQAYYHCTGCKHKGKRFIPLGRKSLTCHDCGKRMITRKAVDKDFPHNDKYGNMFIAGDFMRTEELFNAAAHDDLKKQRNVYLA